MLCNHLFCHKCLHRYGCPNCFQKGEFALGSRRYAYEPQNSRSLERSDDITDCGFLVVVNDMKRLYNVDGQTSLSNFIKIPVDQMHSLEEGTFVAMLNFY